jgi:hypothetical protein
MGVLVGVAGVPLTVGGGRPGVEVEPASIVWAETVYSTFRVAKVSGVAVSAPRLQASWVRMSADAKRMTGKFFVDMVFSRDWFPGIKDEPSG